MKNQFINQALKLQDPEIFKSIEQESNREEFGLELIASENYASIAVMQAQGSTLTNKYAEGYPGKRYYGGCEFVDIAEKLAIDRACQLFSAEAANVQPHSGSSANMAVYLSQLKPGDSILGMSLSHGGHLTHGSPVNFSGKLFKAVHYGLHPETHRLDYDAILDQAKKERPQMIIAGASAYSRTIDFKIFRDIADQVGAKLLVDMAHIAGLVATGHHPTPIPYAHFTTTTTHKTLRGPRGGMILTSKELEKSINSLIFPGIQGGPLMHVIAAKAVAFKEALSPDFKQYSAQVIANAQALASTLIENGFHLVTGGTDNHLMLIDLSKSFCTDVTGKDAENWLDQAAITVNKNSVPGDQRSPFITSGIRVGTPALTTRGFKENEMKQIGLWIKAALESKGDAKKLTEIRSSVKKLCEAYPLYQPHH